MGSFGVYLMYLKFSDHPNVLQRGELNFIVDALIYNAVVTTFFAFIEKVISMYQLLIH